MLKAMAIGRLTQDPELRYTTTGKAVCGMRMACDVGQEKAEFISVVAWDKLAETCGNHLKKGRLIFLEGRIQQREYEAKDKTKRSVYEIVADQVRFLDYAKPEEQPPLPEEPKGK